MPEKTRPRICRSFRLDFPEFVERAEALGVRIQLGSGRRNGRERVFWLDGYRQLTGYTTRSDGRPFTRADAARHIDQTLSAIEQDRAAAAALSVPERFERVMAEFRQTIPQHRMIGECWMPNGDRAFCFFLAEYSGDVHLDGIGRVASATANWRRGETPAAQFARFCAALAADFAAKNATATGHHGA